MFDIDMKPLAGVGWLPAALSAAPLHTSTIIIAHHRSRSAPGHARTSQQPGSRNKALINSNCETIVLTLYERRRMRKWGMRRNGEIEYVKINNGILDPSWLQSRKKWMFYLSHGSRKRETILYANYLNKCTHLIKYKSYYYTIAVYLWMKQLPYACLILPLAKWAHICRHIYYEKYSCFNSKIQNCFVDSGHSYRKWTSI